MKPSIGETMQAQAISHEDNFDVPRAAYATLMITRCCYRCNQQIAPGHIVDGPPAKVTPQQVHAVVRRVYFPCCNYMLRWWEESDARGKLTGRLVDGTGYPEIIDDQTVIDTFLQHHPHLAELEAA